MYFYGLPEQMIDNINIENMTVHSTLGAELRESKNIKLKNIAIYPEQAPALLLENVQHVEVEGFRTDPELTPVFEVAGNRSEGITLPSSYQLKTGKEVAENSVILR